MAESYKELRKLTIEELHQKYDQTAEHSAQGLGFLREEIARRETEAQNAQLMKINRQMLYMTIVITIATVISTIAVIITLFAPR